MDDVGQTLLNWASAFGTLEMVSYSSYNFIKPNILLSCLSLQYLAVARIYFVSDALLSS